MTDIAVGTAEPTGEPDPLCAWQVPGLVEGQLVEIAALPGRITAIVGPNGSGKSALGYWLSQNAANAQVRRVIAHRRLWFQYAGPDITSAQRQDLERSLSSWGSTADSRWLDHAQGQRTGFVLFDLLAKFNDHNSQFVELIKQGKARDEVLTTMGDSLLDRINAILAAGHLGVSVSSTDRASFEARAEPEGITYPISQMSDGEKSALLLAAEVMTVPEASVVIIDEPERHLHRLISASLIEAIVADRPDCHFVVLTHDLDLASSLPRNVTTLGTVGSITWNVNGAPVGWDMRLLDSDGDLPESVRQAILGGRNRLLFLEGERHSLDMRLYELLFPGWTLMPVGGCDQVLRAVGGLLAITTYTWVHGKGIVDGDGRSAEERRELDAKGILSLPVDEVESLLYSDVVRRFLADRQAETLGKHPDDLFAAATQTALEAVQPEDTLSHLAASVAEKVVQRAIFEKLPTRGELAAGMDPIIGSTPSPYPDLLANLKGHLAASDLEAIVKGYPVRDSALPGAMSSALGFKTIADYEAAALASIKRDASLRTALQGLVGKLPEDPLPS